MYLRQDAVETLSRKLMEAMTDVAGILKFTRCLSDLTRPAEWFWEESVPVEYSTVVLVPLLIAGICIDSDYLYWH